MNLIVLKALYSLRDNNSDEVEEILIKKVFSKIDNNFNRKIDSFRIVIDNLPKKEKDLFEQSLKKFLESNK